MLFNSFIFLFGFLPCVLVGRWFLPGKTLRLAFLTGASWFFYAWWDWRYLPVLILATSVDYVAGLWISRTEDEARRRLLLAASLGTNVGILAYFKYAGFFVETLNGIGSGLGLPPDIATLHIVLPIGISFYTFNSMSYTIDIFRRRIEPTRSILEYTTFVALFPHLIAGPIVRFTDLASQLRRLTPRLTSRYAALGAFFLSCGLVKKLLIADQLHPVRQPPVLEPRAPRRAHGLGRRGRLLAAALLRLLGLLGHGRRAGLAARLPLPAELRLALQGREHLGLLASLAHEPVQLVPRLPVHPPRRLQKRRPADRPQPRRSPCSSPGSGTAPPGRSSIWGLLHGFFLAGHAVLRKAGLTPPWVWLNRLVTFLLVCALFVIFRSLSVRVAGDILGAMIGLNGLDSSAQISALLPGTFAIALVALIVFVNVAPNTWQIKLRPRVWQGMAAGIGAAIAIMTISQPHPFIYFQF